MITTLYYEKLLTYFVVREIKFKQLIFELVANSIYLFVSEIVTPYFCFYTGGELISKVKKEITKDPKKNDKVNILTEYCTAMDDGILAARQNLIDRTIHGKPCIESYEAVYQNEAAVKFDPVSKTLSPREMCGEFVKEINELLDLNKSSVANATRYSYLISQ